MQYFIGEAHIYSGFAKVKTWFDGILLGLLLIFTENIMVLSETRICEWSYFLFQILMNVLSTQMIAMIMQPVQILKNLTPVLAMMGGQAMGLLVHVSISFLDQLSWKRVLYN